MKPRLSITLVSAPVILRGELLSLPKGLPLGRPLSPVLANFSLVPLDRVMATAGVGYLRYGDDILLAAETVEARSVGEARLAEMLTHLGLTLRAGKGRRFHYDQAPFVYLGHAIDERGLFQRVGASRLERIVNRPASDGNSMPIDTTNALRSNRRSRTLYVTEPGLYPSH